MVEVRLCSDGINTLRSTVPSQMGNAMGFDCEALTYCSIDTGYKHMHCSPPGFYVSSKLSRASTGFDPPSDDIL
jgi:hypothetical protein